MRCCFSLLVLWVLFLCQGAAQPLAKNGWQCDFEQPTLEQTWVVRGQIEVRRQPVGQFAAAVAPARTGHAAWIKAEPDTLLATRPGVVPASWLGCETLELVAYRPPDATEDPTVEVLALEASGGGYFTCVIRLRAQGWQRVSLPLKWFRPGANRVPSWRRINRLAFAFPAACIVGLDDIRLIAGTSTRAAEPTLDDMGALAFPGVPAGNLRRLDRPHLRLVSDATDLDADMLGRHLERVQTLFQKKLSFLPAPDSAPWLVIFRTEAEYRRFVPRLAERYGGTAQVPTAGGYTILGYALAAWDPQRGTLRSVYTHEYIHALLERTAGIPNKGEWLQEGLATLFQAEFHPDFNLAGSVRQRHRHPRKWEDLCNGQAIRLEDYWQAASLWDCLMQHPRHKEKLAALIAGLRQSGSTDLSPHLQPILGTTWAELSVAWQLHCRNAYGAQ